MNSNLKDRVFLADPHPLYRMGVRQFLEQEAEPPMKVDYETASGKDLLKRISPSWPGLVIMDLNLQDVDGFFVLDEMRRKGYQAKCVILSAYSDPRLIKKAMKAGAMGYLLKQSLPASLPQAIRSVISGEVCYGEGVQLVRSGRKELPEYIRKDGFEIRNLLTPREVEVLKLISEAHSNKEIGVKLFISDQTVGVHRKNIMRKLGVSNVAELIRTAYDHSLI